MLALPGKELAHNSDYAMRSRDKQKILRSRNEFHQQDYQQT